MCHFEKTAHALGWKPFNIADYLDEPQLLPADVPEPQIPHERRQILKPLRLSVQDLIHERDNDPDHNYLLPQTHHFVHLY